VIDGIYPKSHVVPHFWTAIRALAVVSFLAALTAVWFGRAGLLRGAAELWIISDTVGPADAAVIFGGGLSTRPFAAAEYYRKGLVKQILISNVRRENAETLGGLPSHTDMNRSILLKLGVPATVIDTFGISLSNTYQESVALREWAVSTGARSVIVPTEDFESRRIRWILKHEFAGIGTSVQVTAVHNPAYNIATWWQNERALVEFQNEIVKYLFYRFKY
jgi:uncharacterized SAM-binding protein YcdF (DUF218 family)